MIPDKTDLKKVYDPQTIRENLMRQSPTGRRGEIFSQRAFANQLQAYLQSPDRRPQLERAFERQMEAFLSSGDLNEYDRKSLIAKYELFLQALSSIDEGIHDNPFEPQRTPNSYRK